MNNAYQHSTVHQVTSISRNIDNVVTEPGATNYEGSSAVPSQTMGKIREIDIDVEVGGFVSNLSNSSNLKLPKI